MTRAPVALVTGAQQGIGAAAALELARRGHDVALHYHDDPAACDAVAAAITALGRRVSQHAADLSGLPPCTALVADAMAAHGRLDAVICNAGIFQRAAFADLSAELWQLTLDVNLRSAIFVAQAAISAMRAAGQGGCIVNVSSVASFGTENGVHYSASKGGMDAATRAMALDVARDGIRVNGVAPGMIMTAQALAGHSHDDLQRRAAATVPGRMGSADEVARVIAFLASEDASFVNGEVIAVNGGAHMA